MESAREFLAKRKIRSYAELTPAERPTPEPWDDSICQPLVQTALRLDARWPRASLAQIAEIVYGLGNRERFNLREAMTVDIDGVWRLMVIPYDSDPAPTAGAEPGRDAASGFAYSYVACHGATWDAGRGIATDGFVRPSAWSGTLEGKNASFPTAGFNCQATLGSWTEWTIKITAARALKTPKGQQGVLVGTETHSKCQHWKLQARCVDEEQRICVKTGAVSTPERWCLSAQHSRIRALIFPRPL